MTLRELRYVVALAEHGNFARAARACHVSQPTLSAQLKKLEDYLGVRIFERSNKRVAATAAGEALIAQARAVVEAADRLKLLAQGSQDPFAGPLALGVIPTLGPYLLPHVLPRVKSAYPKLRLYLREGLTADLLQQVHAGKLDLVLAALPVELKGLQSAALFWEPFWLAAPPNHALARKKTVNAADLTGENVLLLEEGHCFRDQALAACGARRSRDREDFQATSLETLRQMVASGVGVTLMPALAVKAGALSQRLLRFRPFSRPAPGRTLAALWRPGSAAAPAARALADLIRAHLPPGVSAPKGKDNKSAGGKAG